MRLNWFATLSLALIVSLAAHSASGANGPVKHEELLLDCTLELSSYEPAKHCAPMQVPEWVEGEVRVTVDYFFDTSVCLQFGVEPDVQKVQSWKHGYCDESSFFSFQRNSSIPFKYARVDDSNKKMQRQQPSSHSFMMPASSLWSSVSTGGGGGLGALAAGNVTRMGAVTAGDGTLVPRWSENDANAGAMTALRYYVAAGVTESGFWDGVDSDKQAYGSTVRLQVHSTLMCVKQAGQQQGVGPACQVAQPIVPLSPQATPLQLTGEDSNEGAWVFFTTTIPPEEVSGELSKLKILVNVSRSDQVSKNAITTYVRWQGLPYDDANNKQYDLKYKSSSLAYTATLKSPRAGRYFIGLRATVAKQFDGHISVSYDMCKPGRYGSSCIKPTQFKANKPLDQQRIKVTPDANELAYIVLNASSAITVSAASDAAKAPAIYLGAGFVPTASYYSMSANTGDKVNRISTSTGAALDGSPLDVNWFIAVSPGNQQALEINVWVDSVCASNCSEHGVCAGTAADWKHGGITFNPSGECRCKSDDWVGFACQTDNDHDFKLEYIILIAVGGAIVLVIAIGVPIYCHFARRKRNQGAYERL